MLFEINVKLNDDDYLKFNEFLLIRSYYGKKQMMNRRILIALITLIIGAVVLFRYGLSDALLFASIYCFVMAIYQIFLNKLTQRSIRRRIKFLKKKGKLKYSPESVMRFYDDVLSEITPDEKTERKYSALERVSIVGVDLDRKLLSCIYKFSKGREKVKFLASFTPGATPKRLRERSSVLNARLLAVYE